MSWLIISTRDYKKEYDWFWDKLHFCCYGIPKSESPECISKKLWEYYWKWDRPETYFTECILMPEFQMYDIEEAEIFLKKWCSDNKIDYIEDLEQYRKIEAYYWKHEDLDENDIVDSDKIGVAPFMCI